MSLYVVRADAQALVAATVETLFQVAAASTKPCIVREIGVSFDGTTAANAPVRVRLLRQTTAGTGSGFTPIEWCSTYEASVATALNAYTVEPTAGDVLAVWYVPEFGSAGPPFRATWWDAKPIPDAPVAPVSTRIAVDALAANGVNCNAYMVYEE